MEFRIFTQEESFSANLINRNYFAFFLLGALIVFFLPGCLKQTRNSAPKAHTVFLNSFESPEDTLSWYWAGEYRLTTDTPPGGGKFALEIKGRNALPAGTFISRPLRHGGYFIIECWGKMKNAGGFVQLATISEHEVTEAIQILILEPEWKFLQSIDTLYCPPNRSLMLSLQAGLDREGEMVIDLLQVKKVGKIGQSSHKIDRKIARQVGF
jgi:hypothetical protein